MCICNVLHTKFQIYVLLSWLLIFYALGASKTCFRVHLLLRLVSPNFLCLKIKIDFWKGKERKNEKNIRYYFLLNKSRRQNTKHKTWKHKWTIQLHTNIIIEEISFWSYLYFLSFFLQFLFFYLHSSVWRRRIQLTIKGRKNRMR